MKMTFTCEHHHALLATKPVLAKITYETHQEQLELILEDFKSFLKGAGFEIDGYLDVIPYEESPEAWDDYFIDGHEGMGSTLDDYPELKAQHSQYYFDKDRNK